MSRFFGLLIRFFLISAGYSAAVFSASFLANIIMAGAAGLDLVRSNEFETAGLFVSIALGTLFIGYYAFLPAMAAIVIAEILQKRDWLYFALGGAVVSVAAAGLFHMSENSVEEDTAFMTTALAAGIFAGLVYWIVAGRNSGAWLAPSQSEPNDDHPPRNSSSMGG